MNTERRRILVTLDGSVHSMDAVHYLGWILPPDGTSLVLFNVSSRTPERFWDIEERSSEGPDAGSGEGPGAGSGESPGAVAGDEWQTQHRQAIEAFMENARRSLLERGFPPDAVSTRIQMQRIGIARDIIQEARSGYDAVVAGRQGMNPITRLVIGSVAAKLIASLAEVPLWLVGSEVPGNNRLLVAIDGSDNALRAVEHVADMAGGGDIHVTLFHVIRSFDFRLPGPDDHFFSPRDAAAWPDESREVQKVRAAFDAAVRVLEDRGIAADRISTKVISGVATRSGAIIAQVATGSYGTIIIGRRGHSRAGEFHMGRVTNKVIQLAGRTSVWVV